MSGMKYSQFQVFPEASLAYEYKIQRVILQQSLGYCSHSKKQKNPMRITIFNPNLKIG